MILTIAHEQIHNISIYIPKPWIVFANIRRSTVQSLLNMFYQNVEKQMDMSVTLMLSRTTYLSIAVEKQIPLL